MDKDTRGEDHITNATWLQRWEEGNVPFHEKDVHEKLEKHLDKLDSDGKVKSIFVPMCGKSVDMKWFFDKGYKVVGVDISSIPLEEFFAESKLNYVEKDLPLLGKGCRLLQSENGQITLYCTDVTKFNKSLEGQFDAVWDRGALGSIARQDLPKYMEMMKSIVKPTGRILCEVMEYDAEETKKLPLKFKIPPPYPMLNDDLQRLFDSKGRIVEGRHQGDCSNGKWSFSASYLAPPGSKYSVDKLESYDYQGPNMPLIVQSVLHLIREREETK